MGFFRRFFFHSGKRYLVGLLLAAALVFWILSQRGFDRVLCYVEALTTAGSVLIFIGLLQLVAFWGALDTFGYNLSLLGHKRYADLYDYTQRKKEKRAQSELIFMPFLTVGLFFLIAGLLLKLSM